MRSASFSVSRSPSITAQMNSFFSAVSVASRSAVLPEPGEDIRLIARMPRRSKCSRLWPAWSSFFASRPLSTDTAVAPLATGLNARCLLPGARLEPQVSHIFFRDQGSGFRKQGGRGFQFDAFQQQFVAGQDLGVPVAAGAADQ